MLLGISTIDYIFRSTVPAGGLIILISKYILYRTSCQPTNRGGQKVTTTAGSSVLLDTKSRGRERNIPEAPSPRPIATARLISTSDSSDYPPSRYEDLKAFVQPRDVPLPGQGLSNVGVGRVPIQGQLFPPMRSTTEPAKVAKELPQEKLRTFFKARRKPEEAITVGSLSISNPVLLEGGSNPLDKVATIDLKTAARQEKERRMRTANRSLSTIRREEAAAQFTQAERVKRVASTVPEEFVSRTSEPGMPENATLAVGSASGAQLSPGGEDLRRRSPRRTPSTPKGSAQSMVVLEPNWIPSPTLETASRALPLNQYGIVKTSIPHSLPALYSPEASAPEPDPTPLHRRPTNGLPDNPRQMLARKPPTRSEPQRQETVMFLNNIVYDDPNFVTGVMDGARDQVPKASAQAPSKTTDPITHPQATVSPETPGSPVSVVNRPRPVPRRSNTLGMDIYFHPIGHTRSKSAGALGNRSHMLLQSGPDSSTTLPPLPPPPQTPTMVARPKPNDTNSMTYTEKMTLLFPQPQGTGRNRRRSSLPTLPGTPISSMGNSPTLTANNGRDTYWWGFKTTTTAVQTRSLLQEQEQEQEQAPQEQEFVYTSNQQLSARTYRNMVNETDDGTLPENCAAEMEPTVAIYNNGKRASSPVLPPRMSFTSATTSDDDTTQWDDGISPVPLPRSGLAAQQAPSQRTISAMTNQSGEIEIGLMLDPSVAREIEPETKSIATAEMNTPTTKATSSEPSSKWNQRIGEQTPCFSSRSRRGTPPVPLVLSDRPTLAKQAALVQAAKPSSLPSPEEAFQMIQAQLTKYEQPFRCSVESSGQGRLALLNDLEKEMGQQETRWTNMQQGFYASRDSLSTLGLSSATGTPHDSKNAVIINTAPEEPDYPFRDTSASTAAERRESRRARMASLLSTRPSSQDVDHMMMSDSRTSLWQQRLAEAQMEYLEYANEHSRKRITNLFPVSKADLGSPTPPDSDESGSENESWRKLAALIETRDEQKASKKTTKLWTPPQASEESSGQMWVRLEKPYKQHLPCQDPPLPGLSVRPARRMDGTPLCIESRELWRKTTLKTAAKKSGLWKSPAELQQFQEAEIPTPAPKTQPASYHNPGIQRSKTTTGSRPLTQRPPRRSRRITTLPDIIEDPQPLPDKRGTLGIFQFPWGERSDVAWVQPPPEMFMVLPGTAAARESAMADAVEERANQLELQEYSSSFFDDFDDEIRSESDYSDYADSESDDEGFDESTLWEIASLLQTDDVPSRFSMFPPQMNAAGYMVADYLTEEPEQYDNSVTFQTILDSIEEPEGLQEMSSPIPPAKSPKRTQSTLWQATMETEESLARGGKGLPQPPNWKVDSQMTETMRARSMVKVPAQPAVIKSDTLWVPTISKVEGSKSHMWAQLINPEPSMPESGDIINSTSVSSAPKVMSPKTAWEMPLWKFDKPARKGEHGLGLPQPQDWESYELIKSTVRARTRLSRPTVIESLDLWQAPRSPEISWPRDWLQPSGAFTPTPCLWQVQKQPEKGEHRVGLPHPRNWEKYDIIQATVRTKPRQSQPAAIESLDLWQASQPSDTPGLTDWLLLPRAIATASRLWQVTKQPQRGEHSLGLPHPSNWESYGITTATIRAKLRPSEPAVIESAELWQAQFPDFPPPPSKMWTPRMPPSPVA